MDSLDTKTKHSDKAGGWCRLLILPVYACMQAELDEVKELLEKQVKGENDLVVGELDNGLRSGGKYESRYSCMSEP